MTRYLIRWRWSSISKQIDSSFQQEERSLQQRRIRSLPTTWKKCSTRNKPFNETTVSQLYFGWVPIPSSKMYSSCCSHHRPSRKRITPGNTIGLSVSEDRYLAWPSDLYHIIRWIDDNVYRRLSDRYINGVRW